MRPLAVASVAAALVVLALGTPGARADLGSTAGVLSSFSIAATGPEAGGHPDVTIDFQMVADPITAFAVKNVRSATIQLPPGLLGDPHAVPYCPRARFVVATCPAASVLGTAVVFLAGAPSGDAPVVNLPPTAGEAARVGFVAGQPIEISIEPRSESDFGLTNQPSPLPTFAILPGDPGPVTGVTLTLWGVPHDAANLASSGYVPPPDEIPAPFMSNPTRCDAGAVTAKLAITTWEDADTVLGPATATLPQPTDCGAVPFAPSIHVSPDSDGRATTVARDTPTPLRVDVQLPANADPAGRATSHLRRAVVTLPAGIALSPSAANGLAACTDAQLRLGSTAAPDCPAASAIGTTEVDSPPLAGLLSGKIYLAQPTAAEPYRIFVHASGFGVALKLVGHVHADAASGQITTTFDDLPEVPVRRFTLAFRGGAAAPLATGLTCGTATTTSVLTPWSGTADHTPTSAFAIGGCPPALPWTPGLTAGTSTTRAASSGTFSVVVDRADGQATLHRIEVKLPQGLSAKVGDVPLCSAVDGAAGRCAESSRIGSATIAAGAGGSPVVLHADGPQGGGGNHGGVYLTKGTGGAPFGLSIVVDTRGQAGPFDLGRVVVPAKVDVDPRTAALSIHSDPLPTFLQGIPLRIRRVAISIDRHGFMRTPTSCSVKQIDATLGSVEAGDAQASARFQVGGCSRLPFAPRLKATLLGEAPRFHAHLGLDARLTQTLGQANARSIGFTLPAGLVPDGAELQRACTPAQLAADRCPDASRHGSATATSPLLDGPLRGPAYLVERRGSLPDVVVLLRGQLDLEVRARVRLAGKRLTTTFAAPDVPLSSFELRLPAGDHALLTAARSLCRASARDAQQNAVAHSGKRFDRTVEIAAPRCTH